MNYIRVSVSEMLRIRNPSLTIAQGESHSLSANNRKPLSYMFSMLITVPFRTSSAISSLQVDGLKKQAYVTFKNGKSYAYGNVSTRSILNVLFNPDVSLGFWVNNNLVNSERAYVLNGEEFNYDLDAKREELKRTLELPEFA